MPAQGTQGRSSEGQYSLAVGSRARETEERPPLQSCLSSRDFEDAASRTLSPKAWAFISSAATDLHTLRANESALAAITLRPRVLRNVAEADMSSSILGHSLRIPLFCSPTAMATLVHPAGESAIGMACKTSGLAQCISMNAGLPLENIVSEIATHPVETSFKVPVFFQLFVHRERNRTEQFIEDARASGATALFLTVDAPVPGKREADERIPADPTIVSGLSGVFATNDTQGGALGRTMGSYIDASFSWDDLPWLRTCAQGLPLILKGIQTSEDALLAMNAGVDGIVISNHGGRSLDTAPATILVLLEIRQRCPQVFDNMEVYVDGGFRRGTDIFKALCLGAKAVGLGRGPLFALNYGYEGLVRYFESKLPTFHKLLDLLGGTR